jgi:hypothetical protein
MGLPVRFLRLPKRSLDAPGEHVYRCRSCSYAALSGTGLYLRSR